MAFTIPVAEKLAAYHVETENGTEIVPETVCGALRNEACLTPYESVENLAALEPYLEGSRVESVERREGWYGRLSASGYLDCTEWQGPYETADAALDAVKEQYDVDDNDDDVSE
jgi:hypothetical protein